jgi:hypothetical protein
MSSFGSQWVKQCSHGYDSTLGTVKSWKMGTLLGPTWLPLDSEWQQTTLYSQKMSSVELSSDSGTVFTRIWVGLLLWTQRHVGEGVILTGALVCRWTAGDSEPRCKWRSLYVSYLTLSIIVSYVWQCPLTSQKSRFIVWIYYFIIKRLISLISYQPFAYLLIVLCNRC